MRYRVAVASSDGKVINIHFGQAEQFLIFDFNENGPEFYELRKTSAYCGSEESHDGVFSHTPTSISDCQYVLASRVGRGAEEALKQVGIQVFAMPGLIEPVLQKLYVCLQNQHK
ncbi:MAG TPA: NifB/NifX family molybdenum-iron cluster-binding protein [Syntrophomonadaceae bacterium]|nr:NifB/NifX family molybdenum-iron cluster-binding protein [Syntrophomonadaceae bacterium]